MSIAVPLHAPRQKSLLARVLSLPALVELWTADYGLTYGVPPTVTAWAGRKNGLTLSQATASRMPLSVADARFKSGVALQFDGVDDYLAETGGTIWVPNGTNVPFAVAALLAGRNTPAATFATIAAAGYGASATPYVATTFYGPTSARHIARSDASVSVTYALDGLSVPSVERVLFSFEGAGTTIIRYSGADNTVSISDTRGTTTLNQLSVGCRLVATTPGLFLAANVYAILWFNAALNAADRSLVDQYLQSLVA